MTSQPLPNRSLHILASSRRRLSPVEPRNAPSTISASSHHRSFNPYRKARSVDPWTANRISFQQTSEMHFAQGILAEAFLHSVSWGALDRCMRMWLGVARHPNAIEARIE